MSQHGRRSLIWPCLLYRSATPSMRLAAAGGFACLGRPEEVVPPISLEDSYQAPPKSCGKDPAVWEAACLAAAGAESPGLACSEGVLAGFAGGRWPAGRRVARERA